VLRIFGSAAGLTEVARAGDVNGDRLADVLVSGPNIDGGQGRAWIVFGRASAGTVDVSGDPAAGGFVRIETGQFGSRLGDSLGSVGDMNGDRLDDVIVGAPEENAGQGAAYVIFGRGAGAVNVEALDAGGIRITGPVEGATRAGTDVAGVGDVNGDGRPDVGVGAPLYDVPGATAGNQGAVWVVFGRAISAATTIPLGNVGSGDHPGFRIEGPDGEAGASPVAGAGDVNGDGKAEVAVGAPFDHRATPGVASGSVSIVFGRGSGAEPVPLGSLGDKGVQWRNTGAEQLGSEVRGGSDINGDGIADVVAGAPSADVGDQIDAGRAYVLFGRAAAGTLDTPALAPGTGIRINGARGEKTGPAAQDGSLIGAHERISLADVNGDGRVDVLAAAGATRTESAYDPGAVWTVIGFGAPDFQYPGTLNAVRNVAFGGAGPSAVKRTGSFSFNVAPALPKGLVLDPGTGRISGTPQVAGASTHTVTLSDQAGSVAKAIKINIAEGKDVDPPVISKARLSRKKFRVGKRATPLAQSSAAAGTTLRFTLSEAVSLRLTVACTGRVSKARRKPCTKLRKKGTFRRTISTGGETVFTFTGRVGKTPLKPGRYTITMRATDKVGLPSNQVVLRFTVVKK
jgi:hypothetical protein